MGGFTVDYIEVSAKNKEEAIIKASMQLETPSDELDIQIISEGSSGFLGFGSKPAIIRVRKKDPSELEKNILEESITPVTEKKPEPIKTPVKEPVKKQEAASAKETVKEESAKEEIKETVKEQTKESEKTSRPVELITDEGEIQEIKDRAHEFLTGVFGAMNLEVEIKTEYNVSDKCLDVDFSGEDMGILIGKRGQTLDSLQYLTSLVVNKGKSNYVRVKLDTEDYRSRRKETLENLAKGIAFKVRKTRKPVVLEPMNPYERRIIHSALQGNRYVETFSEGEEPYRHIVVKLKGRRQ